MLVLEAGGEETGDPQLEMPLACGAVSVDPQYLWNDLTAPQRGGGNGFKDCVCQY